MITLFRNNRLILSGLVLAVVYLSQICPYTHFYHSRGDHVVPLEFSLHPSEVDPDRSSEHDDEGHHHHTLDRYFGNWNRARQSTDTVAIEHIQAGSDPIAQFAAEFPLPDRILYESVSLPAPQFHTMPSIPRGPPALV